MARKWVIFWVLAGAYFFVMFHRFCTAVMAGDLTADLGLDPATLGFLSSMYLLGYAAVQIPVGILSDKWGARKTISLFLLLASLGAYAFGQATSFETAVISRWLVGAGVGCVYVPALKLIGCWFGSEAFVFMTGMMLAVGNLGALSSTWPLAVIKDIWGWRATMEVVSIITLVIVVLIWLLVKDHPPESEQANIETTEPPAEIQSATENTASPSSPTGLRIMLKSKRFWAITLYFFAFETTIISFQGLWAGPFLKRVYQMPDNEVGYALTWLALGLMIGAVVSGVIAGKSLQRRHTVLTVGMFGYLLCWVPMVFATSTLQGYLMPLLAFMGFCAGFFSISFGIARECFSASMAGTALGVYNFTGFVGGGLGMWITGLIIGRISPDGAREIFAFQIAFGLALTLMFLGWLMLVMLPRAWSHHAPAPNAASVEA